MFVCFSECSFPFLYRLLTYLSTQRNRTLLNNRIVKTDLWTLRWNDWLSRWYRRTFNINLFMVSDIDRKFMHRKLHKSSYIQVVQICECKLISRGLFTDINLCCSSFICFFFVFSSCSRQLKPNTLFLGHRLCRHCPASVYYKLLLFLLSITCPLQTRANCVCSNIYLLWVESNYMPHSHFVNYDQMSNSFFFF